MSSGARCARSRGPQHGCTGTGEHRDATPELNVHTAPRNDPSRIRPDSIRMRPRVAPGAARLTGPTCGATLRTGSRVPMSAAPHASSCVSWCTGEPSARRDVGARFCTSASALPDLSLAWRLPSSVGRPMTHLVSATVQHARPAFARVLRSRARSWTGRAVVSCATDTSEPRFRASSTGRTRVSETRHAGRATGGRIATARMAPAITYRAHGVRQGPLLVERNR